MEGHFEKGAWIEAPPNPYDKVIKAFESFGEAMQTIGVEIGSWWNDPVNGHFECGKWVTEKRIDSIHHILQKVTCLF